MKRLLPLVVLLLLTGCGKGNRKAWLQLAQIDSLLTHEQADSAWQEVLRVDTVAMGDGARAYYQLLRVQAMWKTYQPVESDSLLDFSLSYYEKNGPQGLLARTYYYKGAVQKEQGLTREAVENLKSAERVAQQVGDALLLSKVYNGLEDVNFAAGNYQEALRYAQMAVEKCREAGLVKLLVEDYETLAVAWHHVGQPDSALYYFEQCLPLMAQVKEDEQAHMLANLGVYYKNFGFPNKAEGLLLRSIEMKPQAFAYRSLANLHAEHGELETAEELYLKAIRLAERADTKISTLQGYRRLKMQMGDYREANELAERIVQMRDSVERVQKEDGVEVLLRDIDQRQEREQMISSRLRAWGLSLMLLALLAGVAVYFLLRKRQADERMLSLQRQIADNAKAIDDVRKEARKAEDKLTELRKNNRQMKDLQNRTSERLEQLLKEQDAALAKMRADYSRQLSHGCQLYEQVMAGGHVQRWYKQDFLDFECYYCMRDIPFSVTLHNYEQLSPQQRFTLIMSHLGRSTEDTRELMGLTEAAWRTMQSRMKKKIDADGDV